MWCYFVSYSLKTADTLKDIAYCFSLFFAKTRVNKGFSRKEQYKMPTEIENINPNVYDRIKERVLTANEEDENVPDPFDKREIFGEFKEDS